MAKRQRDNSKDSLLLEKCFVNPFQEPTTSSSGIGVSNNTALWRLYIVVTSRYCLLALAYSEDGQQAMNRMNHTRDNNSNKPVLWNQHWKHLTPMPFSRSFV